jgi:dihydrofolate reductase
LGGGWSAPRFVLTHHPADTPVTDVNVLGAGTARQCLEAGLLDEILVCIAPVMLGDGVRLFGHPGGTNAKLERLSLTHAPLATNLWLGVVR